ncbi:MAG: monoamine oxidase, partial [Paracoccaceae bacterium]
MPTPAQTASDPLGPRPDVIVLGAGITGVAAALNLR